MSSKILIILLFSVSIYASFLTGYVYKAFDNPGLTIEEN